MDAIAIERAPETGPFGIILQGMAKPLDVEVIEIEEGLGIRLPSGVVLPAKTIPGALLIPQGVERSPLPEAAAP